MTGRRTSFENELVHNSKSSPGFIARKAATAKGVICQKAAPISIDLFNQERLMLNYVDLKLVSYPNTSAFLVETFDTPNPGNYKLHVEDVHLLVEEWDLAEGLCNAIEARVNSNKINYPMTSVQMRSFFIPENRMDSPVSTLFTTHCPRRIVIGLVDSASFNGNYTKSPFNFKHFDLTNIYIDYNGHTLPHRPLALDYEKGRYIDPYLQFLEGLGLSRSERRNGITLDMFENGWNFYVFEISTTARSPGVFDPVQQSNVTCRMEFKKPVPRGGIYAIALAEFDTILSLDSQRNPSFDSIK